MVVSPQTRAKQKLLPMPCFQHIQVEAKVRVEKPLLEERGFAGGLDADEDDGFHTKYLLEFLIGRFLRQNFSRG